MSQESNIATKALTWKQKTKRYSFPAFSVFLGLTVSAFMFFTHKPEDYVTKNTNTTLSYANYVVSSSSPGLTVTYLMLMAGTIWRKRCYVKQQVQNQNGDK